MDFPDAGFVLHILDDPDLRIAGLALCLSIMAETAVANAAVGAMKRADRKIRKAKARVAPKAVRAFSKQCEIEEYNDRTVVLRNGACVAGPLRDVVSVEILGDRRDRVLRIRHAHGGKISEEDAHCGPMDIYSARRARTMLLHRKGGR